MSQERSQPERSQFDEPVRKPKQRIAKPLPKILLVQTGTAGQLAEAHGDYPAWFRQALDADEARMPILRTHLCEKLSPESVAAHGADGIIVTGSPLSMTTPESWMVELGGELLRAGERGVPVLGVCFGHQLLSHASGAQVILNPRGREIGTVELQLTQAGARDPLFAYAREGEFTGRIEVQSTHVDAVYPVPEGATLLASNEKTAVQALRFSETVASVQFHPELRPETLRELIASRREALEREGLDVAKLLAGVRETRSSAILRAFGEQVRHA